MKNALQIFPALVFIIGFASSPRAQWVTTHDPIFAPEIPKPAAMAPSPDPKFGTVVMRLTDAEDGGIASIVPQYSKRQAWNADQSLLLLFSGDGTARLYDGRTYAFKKTLDVVGGEDVFWHPTNPALIYYIADTVLYSYNVETDSQMPMCTFSGYTWANSCGEGNLSSDAHYYALAGKVYDTVAQETHVKDVVVYDLVADSIIARMALPSTLTDFDWVSISPLGNYVVIDYATPDTGRFQGVEVYDRKLNFIWQKPLGSGHSDLGIDGEGSEVLVMGYYDPDSNSGFVKKFRLSDGKETNLIEHSYQFDMHVSCRNESRRDWCFISTFDSEYKLSADSLSWLPFENEVFALKLDGSGEVERIAHHHSRRFSSTTPDRDHSNYWAEPHATVSRDGKRMIFGSNWSQDIANDSSVDAYVVDFSSLVKVNKGNEKNPVGFQLDQNYPNPFNPTTVIGYRLAAGSHVTLKVIDVLGREVATLVSERQSEGSYSVTFQASNLPSGIYFYRLQTGSFTQTRKMILLR
jgi:hypothetical protein